jgi:adenosine deaminase/adenosine deaminase CECR1
MMTKTLSSSLLITLAALAAAASARTPASGPNEAATARHYASLIAGAEPKTAELVLFFSQMPKGGDLHHHYSGAIYA